MRQLWTRLSAAIIVAFFGVAASMLTALAEPDVRVIVPDAPDGVIVSNCYRAVGNIYGKYTFDFCLKQRGTYQVRGAGVRCDGRLTWKVSGVYVLGQLRRTSGNKNVAWSADSFSCRPSLVLGFLGALLQQKRPLLDNLVCDYTPAKGTGQKPISFVAHRR